MCINTFDVIQWNIFCNKHVFEFTFDVHKNNTTNKKQIRDPGNHDGPTDASSIACDSIGGRGVAESIS